MDTKSDEEATLPTVREAVVCLALGLGLAYLGTRFSAWWLRWPTAGFGILLALVTSVYLIAERWQDLSDAARRVSNRLRGYVRSDPVLGTLQRNAKFEAWEGAFTSAHGTVELLISGDEEPAPALVARAREVVADYPALERRVDAFLAEEAAADDELAAEIRALRVSLLRFNRPERPDEVEIVFDSPEETYWTCIYADGELRDLDFD